VLFSDSFRIGEGLNLIYGLWIRYIDL